MSYSQEEIVLIMPRIREMFRISAELERAFPGRKFTLDGHLVGSIGEVLAAYSYGLELLPSSSERHDAVAPDGRMVQIKATQGTGHIALRSEPEHLIVLLLHSDSGEAREIYNGPGAPVWAVCGKWASNGTRSISLAKLKRMAVQVPDNQRLVQTDFIDAHG
jgi:hypothetical protein